MQLVESCLIKNVAVRYGDATYRSLIDRVVRKKLNQCESGLKSSSSVHENCHFIIIMEIQAGLPAQFECISHSCLDQTE